MSGKVDCPICGESVLEENINLHLDLQCSRKNGAGPSSTSRDGISPSGSARRPSQTRLDSRGSSSSKGDDVIVVDEVKTPGVASIFSRQRPKSKATEVEVKKEKDKEKGDVFDRGSSLKAGTSTAEGSRQASATNSKKRPGGSHVGENGAKAVTVDKKPRLNPLIANQPLAERSRPSTLSSYIGQDDLVGPGSLLRARIEAGEGVGSCILWGPPGSGKTTLARLIAKTADADFKELSATSSGTADVRQVFEQAKNGLKLTGRKTILMIDEIHRFNKPQQDLFLPYVENGWVQLIGATTENPSFKVNGALLSRCQVFTLSAHTPESLEKILSNALASLPPPLPHLPPDLLPFLAEVADGDARQALNGLELALKVCRAPRQTTLDRIAKPDMGSGPSSQNPASQDPGSTVKEEDLGEARQGASDKDLDLEEQKRLDAELMDAVRRGLRKGYDRSGEERYDMISALHKCLRGSDGSAAMYWLARMITGGEDPLYIARRLVVVASEDVGLADNHALPLAMATYQACQTIGLPECRINLAHCVAYLAEAPKSTRSYTAYGRAEALATQPPLPGVPLQIRNAPTKLMKKLGYGKEYSYNPGFAHPVTNEYLPFTLAQHSSYSDNPDEHLLKTPEAELRGKAWDEDRLADWETKIHGGKEWEGRKRNVGEGTSNGTSTLDLDSFSGS